MEALHKTKRRLKANLTRLETAVGKLDKTKATEIERKLHFDKLEKFNEEFQDLAIKLSNICDDTEYAEHELDLSIADERIYILKVELLSMQVSGLNSAGLATIKSQTHITFTSIYNKDSAYTVKALIVPKITCKLPSTPILEEWPHACLLQLADPKFREPNNIDVLLGADIFAQLLRKGQQPGPDGAPLALESELGWILVGRVQGSQTTIQVHHVQCIINESLQKFWELEEASTPITTLTDEERRYENHFLETHKRDETGRYVVQLPLRNESQLGLSREIAIARFKNIEKKLKCCPMQQISYNNFLKEYLLLNHIENISETEVQQKTPHYYMLRAVKMSNEERTLSVCPYNPEHIMKSSQFQYHIAKCEKNYPAWVACHYNHCDRMPADKLAANLPQCPNRNIMNLNHDEAPMWPCYSVSGGLAAWNLNFEDWRANFSYSTLLFLLTLSL